MAIQIRLARCTTRDVRESLGQTVQPTRQTNRTAVFSVRPPLQPSCSRGGSYGSSHRAGSNNAYQKRQIPRKRSLQAIPGEGPASKKAAAAATATVVTAEPVIYTTEIVYVYRDLPLVMCAAKSYCQSTSVTTRALQSKGIRDIAADRASFTKPAIGGTHQSLPIELGSNQPRQVG